MNLNCRADSKKFRDIYYSFVSHQRVSTVKKVVLTSAPNNIRFNFWGTSGNTKFSYLAGAVLTVPLDDRFNAQAELLYSNEEMQSGWVEALSQTSRATNNLHYLSVPLLLRCYPITLR